jgi:hypothetical protein
LLAACDVEGHIAKGKQEGCGVIKEGNGGCEGALVVIPWGGE